MIQHDMVWSFTCVQKLTTSQLNLAHRSQNKKVMKKTKNKNHVAKNSLEAGTRKVEQVWI